MIDNQNYYNMFLHRRKPQKHHRVPFSHRCEHKTKKSRIQAALFLSLSDFYLRHRKPASKPAFFQPAHQFDIELAHVKARDILAHQVDHITMGDAAATRHGQIAEKMSPFS